MGFFDGLGKMMTGKPVFEDTKQSAAEKPNAVPQQPAKSGLRDEHGYKVIPEVDVKSVRSRRDGDKMTVTAWIMNGSEQRIRIDSIYLLGQKRQLNQELSPKQSREVTIYQGSVAHSEHDDDAQIVYRLQENGDLFQNDYNIELNRESDGVWTVEELHEEGRTRDI